MAFKGRAELVGQRGENHLSNSSPVPLRFRAACSSSRTCADRIDADAHEGGSCGADDGRDAHRPIEQGDVAQRSSSRSVRRDARAPPRRRRAARRCPTRRVVVRASPQAAPAASRRAPPRQKDGAGASFDLRAQLGEGAADMGRHGRAPEQLPGERRVPPDRRKNEHAELVDLGVNGRRHGSAVARPLRHNAERPSTRPRIPSARPRRERDRAQSGIRESSTRACRCAS